LSPWPPTYIYHQNVLTLHSVTSSWRGNISIPEVPRRKFQSLFLSFPLHTIRDVTRKASSLAGLMHGWSPIRRPFRILLAPELGFYVPSYSRLSSGCFPCIVYCPVGQNSKGSQLHWQHTSFTARKLTGSVTSDVMLRHKCLWNYKSNRELFITSFVIWKSKFLIGDELIFVKCRYPYWLFIYVLTNGVLSA
jgi:hypothetical protein